MPTQQPCWMLRALLAAGCCWLLLAAAAAASSCCWLLHSSQQQQQQHACRVMDAGSFMHACQLLLMRACARRAYCKKCRVNIGSKSSGWPNVPVLIALSRVFTRMRRNRDQVIAWDTSEGPRSIVHCTRVCTFSPRGPPTAVICLRTRVPKFDLNLVLVPR